MYLDSMVLILYIINITITITIVGVQHRDAFLDNIGISTIVLVVHTYFQKDQYILSGVLLRSCVYLYVCLYVYLSVGLSVSTFGDN